MDPRNNPIGELNRFLYSNCYGQLCAAVSEAVGRPVCSVIHQNQISVEVDEDIIFYSFRAFVEYEPEETEAYQFTVRISLDGCSCTLDVTEADRADSRGHGKLPRYGVLTDQSLIPRLYMDEQREEEAERFLRRYCPEALTAPMPVPIRSIMEEQMGLKVEMDIRLPDGAYGQIMASNYNCRRIPSSLVL